MSLTTSGRVPRRLARGTTSEVSAYTGPSGEVVLNTDTKRLHVQDGVSAGGKSLAFQSEVGAVVPGGRLTPTSGAPVLTADVTAAGTIYYTPYVHGFVPLYNGADFVSTAFAEIGNVLTDATKNPAAAVANTVYDLFVWNDNGTIRLSRGPAWTSTTARGAGAGTTELVRVKGTLLNAQAIANGPAAQRGTYVGSFVTNGSATVDFKFGSSAVGGGAAWFGVWNAYNRIKFTSRCVESAATWTYSGSAWRSLNNSTGNSCSFLNGLAEGTIEAAGQSLFRAAATAASGSFGLGYDSATAPAPGANAAQTFASPGVSGGYVPLQARYSGRADLGLHYLQMLEQSDGTNANTFHGASYEMLAVTWVG